MAKVLLGFLLGLAVTSFAMTRNNDGSITLTPDEVIAVEQNWYQLNYNFRLAVDRVNELSRELEAVQKAKCS